MSRGPALNLQNAPLVIAHRGASRHAPENTCLAVSTAIDFGADMVEVDVQLTLDGYAVIFHDSNLGRVGRSTQYGRRQLQFVTIGGLPLQKVKQFDIGRWMSPAFAGLSIPTLEELLATVEGRIGLNLELKVLNAGAKDLWSRGLLIERVRQALRRYSSQSSLLVSSFDVPVLELAHAAFP
ncbi:MAG: hypothetical protein M3Z35_11375, partial [Nitrospirota bacterium]|nr:hypothetical protein [Nitrospirota bacterium]